MFHKLWKRSRRPSSSGVRRSSFRPVAEQLERREVLSYLPRQSLYTNRYDFWFTSADFNEDGRSDLVVTVSVPDNFVRVYLADDGGFSSRSYPVAGAHNPITGDFNGDDHADLVLSARGGLHFMAGAGDGTLEEPRLTREGNFGRPMRAADFTGDGILDLLSYRSGPLQLEVFVGNGNGTFSDPQTHSLGEGSSVFHIALGDFNADAVPDVALVTPNRRSVLTLLSQGDGTFAETGTWILEGTDDLSVAAGDVNGDGVSDLVVGGRRRQENRSGFAVLLSAGDGTFELAGWQEVEGQYLQFGSGSGPQALGDINQDGWLDVVSVAGNYGTRIDVFLNDGQGGWRRDWSGGAGGYLGGLHLADFNGDAFPDLALYHAGYYYSGLAVLMNGADWTQPGPGGTPGQRDEARSFDPGTLDVLFLRAARPSARSIVRPATPAAAEYVFAVWARRTPEVEPENGPWIGGRRGAATGMLPADWFLALEEVI